MNLLEFFPLNLRNPIAQFIVPFLWLYYSGISIAEQTTLKPDTEPKYPYEIHSMQDVHALTEYFFRDLQSQNLKAVSYGLMYLEMMDETYPRLLTIIRHELPTRVKNIKPGDASIAIDMSDALYYVGDETDIAFLKNLAADAPYVGLQAHLLRVSSNLEAGLKRVKEGGFRFGKTNKPSELGELPPETSPLSKPIPPLAVKKEEEPVPPPVKPLQQPTVKQVDPLPVHVEDRSWMLWLLAIFAALGGIFWLMRKSTRS